MSTPPAPARLHVLLARESPMALVIRRGPSRYACTIGWDRRDATFSVGQWMHARLFERQCDISPDGKHWVYFAMDARRWGWRDDVGASWTAIARTPYLKAIGLWPGCGTWGGGGLFLDGRTYSICDRSSAKSKPVGLRPASWWRGVVLDTAPGREPLYWRPLLQDGWRELRVRDGADDDRKVRGLFERAAPAGWALRKLVIEGSWRSPKPGRALTYDEHQLRHEATGRTIDLPDWEWADMDRERLVYAERGCLYVATLTPDGLGEPRLLHDFNGMTFEPIAAPY